MTTEKLRAVKQKLDEYPKIGLILASQINWRDQEPRELSRNGEQNLNYIANIQQKKNLNNFSVWKEQLKRIKNKLDTEYWKSKKDKHTKYIEV